MSQKLILAPSGSQVPVGVDFVLILGVLQGIQEIVLGVQQILIQSDCKRAS